MPAPTQGCNLIICLKCYCKIYMRKMHSKWDTVALTHTHHTHSLSASFKINFCSRELLRIALSRVYRRFPLSFFHISKSHTAEIIQKKKICIYTIARQSIRPTEIYLHDGTGEWTELKLNPASHPMWTCIFAGFFSQRKREGERERSAISSFLAGISLWTALDFIDAPAVCSPGGNPAW